MIQHILEHGQKEDKEMVFTKVRGQLVQLSKHKFASNVVEKCVAHGSNEERHQLIEEILQTRPGEG